MKIIKQYEVEDRGTFRCTLHPHRTGKENLLHPVSFATLTALFKAAQADFPGLKEKDIEVFQDKIFFNALKKPPRSYKCLPSPYSMKG